jgi:hypothetical protein
VFDKIYVYGGKPFGIASFFVLVALLWTFLLQHVIAYPFVFLFFGAVMGSAWFGGLIAGFISVVLSSLLITYFFIPPLFSITVQKESQSFLTAFIVCAIAISVVSSARKRAESAVRQARDELEMKVLERTADLERSNREILERERHLRTLTEAIPQQIWAFDTEGNIQYVNQHLKSYLGVESDSIGAEELADAVHPDDRDAFTSAWQAAITRGESFELEARVRGNGQYRWFLIRGLSRLAHDGGIEHWYGINIDIDTQHQAQQSLTLAQEAMSRSARILSMAEMAASIAHELNQPTTALVSHAYACRDWAAMNPPNLDKVRSTAEKLVNESTRASQVVKRVRALFSNQENVRETVDLNGLVQDFGRLIRDEIARRGVHLKFELAPDPPPIAIDPVQMQQVLANLARNAMDAMQSSSNRALTIRTARLQDAIEVEISDTGTGIPLEQLPHIFEPFYSTKSSGTGMGLAICRSIVEAHGGSIRAMNALPCGAAIRFNLPLET